MRWLAYCALFWSLLCVLWADEICNSQEFQGNCPENEVISMTTALYGRMRHGTCIQDELGYIGCQNDVLFLLDRWCSGRQQCTVAAANNELGTANTDCIKGIILFLEVDYQCLSVTQSQSYECRATNTITTASGGYLSSHVTDKTGCGSHNAPWVIEVQPGQTIDLWLLDFSALERPRQTLSSCPETYGYVQELSVNITICGDHVRRKQVYTSKTNRVVVTLLRRQEADSTIFLIQYTVNGCSDITPPSNAWYKREGSDAVIGCKSDDRVWRLGCAGNTWEGKVGNCSTEKSRTTFRDEEGPALEFNSVIMLTGVVCAAVLLVIVVVVAGTVYIKKQSIRHDVQLKSEYSAATWPRDSIYATKGQPDNKGQGHGADDNQPLVRIWDNTMTSQARPM